MVRHEQCEQGVACEQMVHVVQRGIMGHVFHSECLEHVDLREPQEHEDLHELEEHLVQHERVEYEKERMLCDHDDRIHSHHHDIMDH